MALSKKTVNKHNLKRAEVFAAHGLGDHDVALAHPAFLGYGDATCILCGKQGLRWLFAIRFDAPDLTTALGKVSTGLVRTEEVTLQVVGSKCITDWLQAVPESLEKLEALKRWDAEMDKLKAAKKLKVCEDLCAEVCEERGLEIEDGKTARDTLRSVYYKIGHKVKHSALAWKDAHMLGKNASKVWHGTTTRKTAQEVLKLLIVVLDEQAKIDAAKAAETEEDVMAKAEAEVEAMKAALGAKESDVTESDGSDELELDNDLLKMKDAAEAELVQRYRNAWDDGSAGISEWARSTLIDISKKVVKYRSFASASQRGLFVKLLTELEQKASGEPEPEEEPVSAVLPGAADYVSPSGIDGARY